MPGAPIECTKLKCDALKYLRGSSRSRLERLLLHSMPQTSSGRGEIWEACLWSGGRGSPLSSINLSFFVVFHRNLSDRSHSVDAELLKSASTSTDKIEIEEDCAVDFFPIARCFFYIERCLYKIQSESQNQSRHPSGRSWKKLYPSTPSSWIDSIAGKGRSKKESQNSSVQLLWAQI